MKTLGQVLRDAVALLREENAKRYRANQDQITNEQSDEIVAQAILAHAIANAEPVAYRWTDRDGFGDIPRTRYAACPPEYVLKSEPLFTVPQPLPSYEPVSAICKIEGKCQMSLMPTVDEIAEAIFDADAVVWSWLEATNEQKEKYRVKAKAVEALLKGEK